jgi:hypothetical protein
MAICNRCENCQYANETYTQSPKDICDIGRKRDSSDKIFPEKQQRAWQQMGTDAVPEE